MAEEIIGYCLRCKAKRKMLKPFVYQFKTHKCTNKEREGSRAIKGFCEVCGTKMFKILQQKDRFKNFDF